MAKRLKNLGDVRRFLARIINQLEAGQIDPSIAGKLGYLTGILTRVIEGSDLENRVSTLEKDLERKR